MARNEWPEGWEVWRLPEAAKINPTIPIPGGCDSQTLFPFVPMANVSEASGAIVQFEARPLENLKSGKTRFQSGDILFAKITPCVENGKVALAPQIDAPLAFASTEFHVVRPGPRLLPEFAWIFLRSKSVRDAAVASMTGSTGRQRVPKSFLDTLEISLPSLDEQRRIVARIEELTRRVEEARGLRQAARQEAAAIMPAALAEVFGRAEKDGWDMKQLPEVAEINPTYRLNTDWNDGMLLPFVPMANVNENTGAIMGFETRPLSQLKSGKTRFQSGDLLFAKITPCVENGKVALAPQLDVPVAFASTEFHVVQPGPRLLPKFAWLFLRSKSVRDAAVISMTGSTGRQRVPKDFMMTLVIPVPPLSEQRRIVAYLDGLQARVEALRRLQDETQTEIEAMTGAVLTKAFRGEL